MLTCKQCGQTFQPKDQNPGHLRRNPPQYCSRLCAGAARKSRVVLTCRQCGQQFERKAYMADWSQERGPFCGFRCYGLWQKAHMVGEANPNYTPASPRRGSSQWERNRLAALERDGHRCRQCGNEKWLHVHHKHEWNPEAPDPHALDNLETLCAKCHRQRHPVKREPAALSLSTH